MRCEEEKSIRKLVAPFGSVKKRGGRESKTEKGGTKRDIYQ